MIYSGTSAKSTTGRNASATLAFHQYRKAQEEDGDEASGRAQAIKVTLEDAGTGFRAKLHVEVVHVLNILGPKRHSRPEAICDGMELGRAYIAEGTEGAKKAVRRLETKRWSPHDIANADEEAMEKIGVLGPQKTTVEQKLIPPGEGWTRYDDDKLIEQRSEVLFVQLGPKAGQYLKRDAETGNLATVGMPHVAKEFPVTVSAGSGCSVRSGTKLDRAVILNDITKIARLALKFPLSFVDTPACAYALFQGLRNSESAQWCAENFHKKLLPILAEKIHTYEDSELEGVLTRALQALDAELLTSPHAFSGCAAIVALVLGRRIVVGGVGRVRAVLLPERGPARTVLAECSRDITQPEEAKRLRGLAGAALRDGLLFCSPAGCTDDADRILAARHAFEVFQLDADAPIDAKNVKAMYRKLALRVHPDKVQEGADATIYKMAFARLDSAKDAVEAMLAEDGAACKELHKLLCCDVRTKVGAMALLGAEEPDVAEKAAKEKLKGIEKMHLVSPDFRLAMDMLKEAVATLRRCSASESTARQEALLKEGLSSSQAMGARDMRFPYPLVGMRPEASTITLPNGRCRIGLLCGAATALPDEKLMSATASLAKHPKASALQWCLDADEAATCTSALCLYADTVSDTPAAKKQRTAGGPAATVRVRHILFAHQQLRQQDQHARRPARFRTAMEAELAALKVLQALIAAERDPNAFLKACREHSDCPTGEQPGLMCGDLGWISKGQQEAAFEEAAFSTAPKSFSDLVTTSRGIHILQRLA